MPGAKHHNAPPTERNPWPEPFTPGPDPAFRRACRDFPRLVRTYGHAPDEGLALARALGEEMEERIRAING